MTNWYTDQDDPVSIIKFREFVPVMLDNIKNFIETKSTEEAVTALGVFDDIVESVSHLDLTILPRPKNS